MEPERIRKQLMYCTSRSVVLNLLITIPTFPSVKTKPHAAFVIWHNFILLLLLLTAIGLMPGGSVYKDKIHEHPQYNTVHMSTIQVHEHYKTQETENT
jgi:hypothetical protein